ncbi:MAG: DUF2162 family putative transporter [Desulfatitalea sp.]
MSYPSLILGVLFSIGLFAVKSGVGVAYAVSRASRFRTKAGTLLLFALVYGALFVVAALLLTAFDAVRHWNLLQDALRSGMLLHLILAGVMLVWGVVLLRRGTPSPASAKGWLLLAVPCPVCTAVIFFSMAFLCACFPDAPTWAALALYLAFMLLQWVSVGVIIWYGQRRAMVSESFLGGAMVLIALYFFLSVTVMPQFAEAERVFRMARRAAGGDALQATRLAWAGLAMAAAFVGGFGARAARARSVQ